MTWQDRLQSVLRSWEGTPYKHGQQVRGVGVDCVHFVDGVLQELYQKTLDAMPREPRDLSFSNHAAATRTIRRMLERYPARYLQEEELESGDVIIVRPTKGAPGHVVIAGVPANIIWHAAHPCVCWTGLATLERICAIYRPLEKESWAIPAQ